MDKRTSQGFTLIELSIVLIIVSLIVGGILIGSDLKKSAEVRSQISQIEKYKSAVNTFTTKYGYLPGDMPPGAAQQFGFTVGANCTGSSRGLRNGDGIIDGWWPLYQYGETSLFWQDLSSANLIDGSFPNGGGASIPCTNPCGGPTLSVGGAYYIGYYFPSGKIGVGTFVYVYEYSGFNWYGLSLITQIDCDGNILGSGSISVIQSYNIDKKIDDGMPTTGSVTDLYVQNPGNLSGLPQSSPNGNPDTSNTCYNSVTGAYSIGVNSGTGPNCALSFKF